MQLYTAEQLLREALIYSSHRRRPVSSALIFLDSGLRRNDEASDPDESGINQQSLSASDLKPPFIEHSFTP